MNGSSNQDIHFGLPDFLQAFCLDYITGSRVFLALFLLFWADYSGHFCFGATKEIYGTPSFPMRFMI
jgi:hypothetical protein